MAVLLSVADLKTHFYTSRGILRAVDGASLDIAEKECVALVGESACGKSTLAHAIMRIVPYPGKIVQGKILFRNETDLCQLSEGEMRNIRGKDISMIFQDPTTYLNPTMKIGDMVAEAILVHQHIQKKDAYENAAELLALVRLPSPSRMMHYYPYQLSGGMLQRVMIAIALSCEPALLIADEPTTALDVTIQAQILDLIKSLVDKLGLAMLLITHDLGIVAETCDRVCVMYAGKVVEVGDVYSLYEKPRHPYTAGLLDSVLSIDEFRKEIVTIDGTVPDPSDLTKGCRFYPRCKRHMEVCRETEPCLKEFNSNQKVACFLY